MNSDLEYPIDIMRNEKTKKYTILDGLHRALKAKVLNKEKINVRKMKKELLSKIVKKYL
jgi:hypothetical protein